VGGADSDTSHGAGRPISGICRTHGAWDFAAPTLWPHLVRSIVLLTPVAVSLIFLLVGMGFSIMAGLGAVSSRGMDLGPSIDSGLMLLGTGGIVVFGMVWLVSLFVPFREVVAGDGVLIEDAATAATAVYGSIKARVDRRAPPFTVRPGQLDGSPALRVSSDSESALIIVRESGPDLRVGWTMWRSRSAVGLIGDMFPGARGHDIALLRENSCSTMRELLKSATEHGVRQYIH